jgi:hypothetical protein
MCYKRSATRKAYVYLLRKHTCATNREIGEIFRTLSYSAVAEISQGASKQLGVNCEFLEQIRALEVKYSLFKVTPIFHMANVPGFLVGLPPLILAIQVINEQLYNRKVLSNGARGLSGCGIVWDISDHHGFNDLNLWWNISRISFTSRRRSC